MPDNLTSDNTMCQVAASIRLQASIDVLHIHVVYFTLHRLAQNFRVEARRPTMSRSKAQVTTTIKVKTCTPLILLRTQQQLRYLGHIKHLMMMMMMRHRHTAAVPLASSLLLCSFRLNVFSVLSYCYVCQTADCSIHTRPTERQSGLTSHMTFVCVALPPLDHQVYVDDERHLTETDRAAIQTPPTTPHVRLFYMGGPGP